MTWIGHSTVLLDLDGARLLTDPVLGGSVSYLAVAGLGLAAGTIWEIWE